MHVTRGMITSRTRGDRKSFFFFFGGVGGFLVLFFIFLIDFIEDPRPTFAGKFCGEKEL